MEQRIRAIYRDISQLVIGTLVGDNASHIVLKNPVLLGVSASDQGQISLNFIPMEMLSIERQPISLRNLLSTPLEPIMHFNKANLLIEDVPVAPNILENYVKFSQGQNVAAAPTPAPGPSTAPTVNQTAPENNIVKLF